MKRYQLVNDEPEQRSQLPSPETPLGTGLRNVATLGARGAEAILGGPGDIAAGVTTLANEALGLAGLKSETLGKLPGYFPTSENIRQHVTKPIEETLLPKNYLTPQSGLAEIAGDAVGFLSSVASNPFNLTKIGKTIPFVKKVGQALLAKGGQKAAEFLGFGPLGQAAAAFGTVFLGSKFGGRKEAVNLKNTVYDNADEAIIGKNLPKTIVRQIDKDAAKHLTSIDKRITSSDKILKENANKLRNLVGEEKILPKQKTTEYPLSEAIERKFTKEPLTTKVRELKPVKVADLWQIKKDLNSHLREIADPKSVEAQVTKDLLKIVNKPLQDYGKINPEFGQNFNLGENIYAGLQAADDTTKFIREKFTFENIAKKPITKILAWGLSPTTTIAGISSGVAIRELAKYKDLLRSPAAVKIYENLSKAALEHNAPLIAKYTAKMDREVERYDRKHKITPTKRYILED